MPTILPLDLNFQDTPQAIACFVIPYMGGVVLVDPGPSSTLAVLRSGLRAHGLALEQVTHVLITHIHLDHVGAAGVLAQQGVEILVHPRGAPHLLDPSKLIASAARLYGDRMEALWGPFLPVPPERLSEVEDGQLLQIGELRFTALHTPGHADHHVTYLLEDAAFCGDVGGVRLPGPLYLRLPFVPPETHLEKWARSLERIRANGVQRIAPTHFGVYEDAPAHLTFGLRLLEETAAWLEQVMPAGPTTEELIDQFRTWMWQRGKALGLSDEVLAAYEAGNPASFCVQGLMRYWRKVRQAETLM
jgi:glyoxylase-like metal-dependent hydrolase (beta-lactamase superfamily II)